MYIVRAKSFDTAAISLDGWPKMATMARSVAEYYVPCWEKAEWPPEGRMEASSSRAFPTS